MEREYRNSGNKPDDIPSNPQSNLQKQRLDRNSGDWLGTGMLHLKERDLFRSVYRSKRVC